MIRLILKDKMSRTGKTKILVTGGSGLIGAALANYLVKKGYIVNVLDMAPCLDIEGINYFQGSILSKTDIAKAMDGCDYVFHLAALLGVKYSTDNALKCLDVNVIGTRNVLQEAVNEGVKKVVFASSSEVYGEQGIDEKIKETAVLRPISEYGFSKCLGEEYCKAFKQKYDLDYGIIRFFNIYGPNQALKFVMPLFIHHALEKKPIQVFGNGSQKRCFCYVEDAVKGIAEVMFNRDEDNQIFNIGNDKEAISMFEMAKKVSDLVGCEAEPIKVPFEESDREETREIYNRIGDITKAKEVLGFEPKISIEEGIRRIIDYGCNFKSQS